MIALPEGEGRIEGRELRGKRVVSKTGKYFGIVKDILFDPRSGEIIYIVLGDPSKYAMSLDLEKGERGELLLPFYAVIAIGDFVVVSEEDII